MEEDAGHSVVITVNGHSGKTDHTGTTGSFKPSKADIKITFRVDEPVEFEAARTTPIAEHKSKPQNPKATKLYPNSITPYPRS